MQAFSLGDNGDSLGAAQPGGTAPLILASPNSRAKLLLLEKRLTGGDSRTEQPPAAHSSMAHAAAAGSNSRQADEAAADMVKDAQLCGEIQPPLQQQQQQPSAQQQTPPGSTAAPASKRRKTGNPKHRPASSEPQHDSSRGPHATSGTKGDSSAPAATPARDKTPNRVRASPNRARASPRVDRAGDGAEGGPGSSNPPMSPVAGISGGHGLQRTPRSHSKQQAVHSRGQTNISKFFPLVMEGSSRDSDTPAHALQQQQQHAQQQQRRPQQQQQQQPLLIPELTPIEEIFIDAAHPSQQHDQQQQAQQLPQQLLGRQRSGSCERSAPAAGAVAAKSAAAAANAAHGAAARTAAAAAAPSGKAQRGGLGSKGSTGSGSGSKGSAAALQQQQQQLLELQTKHQQELEQVQQLARQEELRLQGALSSSQQQVEQMSATILQLQQELAASRSSSDSRQAEVRSAVTHLVTQLAVSNGRLSRLQLSLDGTRLGCLGFSRTGPLGFTEVWEDGPVLRELSVRLAALARAREEVEAARKALRKKLPPPPKATAAAAAAAAAAAVAADASSSASAPDSNSNGSQYLTQADFVMQDELLKVRLSVLKREEELLVREEERLQQEKMRHIRSLKRVRDEDSSRFSGQPTLHGRYVLLQLLGRGGFSEVHKAYDLDTLGFVAVKIHQLNSTWSEARKASYVRHAVREYTIHKALHHRNIVSLTDIFEVDNTTFATVLELCEGGDLEGHLQQFHTLPEREARAIIAQVFAGLAHLNRADATAADASGPRVIHYDLKPANILFDSLGTVKITDFGLSKVVEEGQTMGMELTSQGAGTYWYLPPECFATAAHSNSMSSAAASRRSPAPGGAGHGLLPAGLLGGGAAAGAAAAAAAAGGVAAGVAPLISNKVDVWSAGVILFQMLYGRRPFGEGLTQEQIYRDGVMLNARQVQFPAKPVVSAEGKAFISRCLAYNQEERWDVLTAAADPYLQLKR